MEESVSIGINHLAQAAEQIGEPNRNLHSALGEIIVNGVTYQIQISLVADKKAWCGESDVLQTEITKVHKDENNE